MKVKLPIFILVMSMLIALNVKSQNMEQTAESHKLEIEKFRTNKDKKMLDPGLSPLVQDQIEGFKELSYFPINLNYQFEGKVTIDESHKEVSLTTNSGNKINLIMYGVVSFKIDGKSFELTIFQNKNLPEFGENNNQLFIPFTDMTSGKETNDGGRYLAVDMPDAKNVIILDFNKAMNPYSAYNGDSVSVISPEQNSLINLMLTGERKYEDR